MGHDSEHAALIYQHAARGADAAITNAIDAHGRRDPARGGRSAPGVGTSGSTCALWLGAGLK
jgi:hypothetical protein